MTEINIPPPDMAPAPGILLVADHDGQPVFLRAVATTCMKGCDYCGKAERIGFALLDFRADPPTAAMICADEFVMNLVLRYFRLVPDSLAGARVQPDEAEAAAAATGAQGRDVRTPGEPGGAQGDSRAAVIGLDRR